MNFHRPAAAELRRGEAAATWGSPSMRENSRQPTLIRFRPFKNTAGTVLGFASIQLSSGMILHGCKLMRGPAGRHWISPPAERQTDREGAPVLGEDGKQRWAPIVDFVDKPTRDRFGELVLGLIRATHPDVFEDAS